MTELNALILGEQIDLLSRQDFNSDVEDILTTVDSFDPIYSAALADRLDVLAKAIKDRVKETASMMLLAYDKTSTLYGDTFTLKETPVYVYPADSQLTAYEDEIDRVKKKLEPYENELKGLNESIKARQKQLIISGVAELKDTNYSYQIKKK